MMLVGEVNLECIVCLTVHGFKFCLEWLGPVNAMLVCCNFVLISHL